jgi:hypothetical protein
MLGWPNADAHLDRRHARADDGLSQSWGAQGALDSMAHVVDLDLWSAASFSR